ncbi:MAG: hypothetical protein L0J71_05860 [Bifidobacterium crudilactis]|nr:hypothetical protein [Bifidobacterium crudilactis]
MIVVSTVADNGNGGNERGGDPGRSAFPRRNASRTDSSRAQQRRQGPRACPAGGSATAPHYGTTYNPKTVRNRM